MSDTNDGIREVVEFRVWISRDPDSGSYQLEMADADGRGPVFRSGHEPTPEAACRNLGWMRDQAEDWALRFGCEIVWPETIKVEGVMP